MALTYAQLDTLTTTDAFLGRVRNALRHYANYLVSGTPTSDQTSWINAVFYEGRCAQKAANMAGQLVQDAAFNTADPTTIFTADDTSVTDAALESAVEKICIGY